MKYFSLFLGAFFLFINFGYSQITSFPWSEDFEDVGLPTGWTQEYTSASVDWSIQTGSQFGSPSAAFSGSTNAFFVSANFDEDQTILVSPQFDITSLTNPVLTFHHAQVMFDGGQDELHVYYKTSAAGSWNLLESYTSNVTDWTERQIVLPETSDDFYLGFSAKSGYGFGVCLDLVGIQNVDPCLDPSNISVVSTTSEGATISWTNGATETNWQIEYGLDGFTQGGGTVLDINSNPYSITGLDTNEDYQFYLRSFCDPLYSDWQGPFSFSTICDVVNSFPYNEGFENETAPPICWRVEYENPSPAINNEIIHTGIYSFEGDKSIRFSSYYIGAPYGQYLVSREFDFSQQMLVTFRYRKNTTGSEIFCVGTSNSNDDISSFSWQDNVSSATTSWQYYSFEVPANTKHIAINYKSNFQNSLFIDDFEIKNVSDCYAPIDLNVISLTGNTAEIDWTALNGETSWTVEYGTSGFSQGWGTEEVTTSHPYTITGLDPETTYDFYITADCGGSSSEVSEVHSFTTPQLCSDVENLALSNIDFESFLISWNNNSSEFYEIEYGLSGFSQGSGTTVSSITQITHTLSSLLANTEYDIYVRGYCGAANGYSEWSSPISATTLACENGCNYSFELKDYWSDGWGNVSIGVYQDAVLTNTLSLESGSSQTFDVFICETANVEIKYNQGDYSDECGFTISSPYGVIIHEQAYETLAVLSDQAVLDVFDADCTEPSCFPPTAFSFSELSYNSVLLSWTAGASETEWTVEYGSVGFTPGTGTSVTGITTTDYLLEGLISETEYDVYVYAICDVADVSSETGPLNFTTFITPIEAGLCGLNIDIPDNGITNQTFDISGYTPSSAYTHFNIESVEFIIEHQFDADIDLTLESPEGISLELFSDVGGSGDNFGDISGTCLYKTILSLNPTDGPITAASADFNGNYSAEGDINEFNTGADLNGIWKLKIKDDSEFFTGKLQYFNINLVETKAMVASESSFVEVVANDGSIDNTISLDLYGETFAVSGVLTENTDYTTQNLPSGLSVSIEVLSTTNCVVTLNGNSDDHIYDINDFTITFLDILFTGADATKVEGSEQVFLIDFFANMDLENSATPGIIEICEGTNGVTIPYSITNEGETIISSGSEILLTVEYPIGTVAFVENIVLTEDLDPTELITGTTTQGFNQVGSGDFQVKTSAYIDGELDLANNDNLVDYVAISHHIEFPQATNDTIYAAAWPYSITTSPVFEPSSYSESLFYFWNGMSGSSTFDAFSEGWIYLSTESSYCNHLDSVYIRLSVNVENVQQNTVISAYPNPFTDNLTVSSSDQIERVIIFSIDGKLILDKQVTKSENNTIDIPVSNLMPGTYIMQLQTTSGYHKKHIIKI